ncbi:hypothetical protein Y032_0818g2515 [Ancylostoma ceylanicum]|uniref:Uncharacterized protein n=1 Tax=Ancylostoma ceylanicum TaxID=53326 RepID=A0A016WC38_9BILA|nr:hypothetical protein Y032_0818g2515 [Ancylostoma ceylanicum]
MQQLFVENIQNLANQLWIEWDWSILKITTFYNKHEAQNSSTHPSDILQMFIPQQKHCTFMHTSKFGMLSAAHRSDVAVLGLDPVVVVVASPSDLSRTQ